ncbi:lipid A deacylase LpxR family protein [Magnetovibrio sp. PR-2]|uniref:lipid A deacylase LpxR family protein n=1 Tax=Magnetovibrio sp. PR-2 TaxID=3120356 RepID=UPI002FCE4D50
MTFRLSALIVCALGFCAWSSPAWAGDFLFQWDNDKVADTDRHYTNGMRIGYVPDDMWAPFQSSTDFLVAWLGFGGFGDIAPAQRADGWVFGQDMYTPEDVLSYTPDPNDRPYAGWTYVGLTSLAQTQNASLGMDQQDTLEVDIGIVGPEARAGETQNWFHRQINVAESNGWNSQIGTEPGLLITRTVKLRSQTWDDWNDWGLGVDAIPHATGQLGNIKIGASAGLTFRFGQNLREDFGPIYGTFAIPRQAPKSFVWAFYAGAEGRAVVRDIFLDGNTLKDSPDVDRNPFVLESRFGLVGHVPVPEGWGLKGARMDLSHVIRSREFRSQDKIDRYGSFKLILNF